MQAKLREVILRLCILLNDLSKNKMESIITVITLLTAWISISSFFNNIIISSNKEIVSSKKNISLAFSIGFIFLFASLVD